MGAALVPWAFVVAFQACQVFCDFLKLFQVVAAHHGDGFHERGTASVHACYCLGGFVGVAEFVFHHAHDTVGVFCAVGRVAEYILIAQVCCFRGVEAFFGWKGCAYASGQVGQCLIFMVNVVSCQAASRIGQHFVRNLLPGGELG